MPSDRIDPLNYSRPRRFRDRVLYNILDAVSHDDALRIVRRLHQRFPCMAHERIYCHHYPPDRIDADA